MPPSSDPPAAPSVPAQPPAFPAATRPPPGFPAHLPLELFLRHRLALTADGHFLHLGQRVEHPRVVALFFRALRRHDSPSSPDPDGGGYWLHVGKQQVPVEVETTPYFVVHPELVLDNEGWWPVSLRGGLRARIQLDSLTMDAEGRLRANALVAVPRDAMDESIGTVEEPHPVSFTREAMADIAGHVAEPSPDASPDTVGVIVLSAVGDSKDVVIPIRHRDTT